MRHLLLLALVAGCVEPTDDAPLPPDEPPPAEPAPPQDPQEPTTPNNPAASLEAWQQCMTLADFQASNMTGAWAGIVTTSPTGMKCTSCHNGASYGFVATTNAQTFFDVLKTDLGMLQQFVDLTATGVVVDEQTIPTAGTGRIPEHPRFNAATGMAALRDFHQRTQMRCALL